MGKKDKNKKKVIKKFKKINKNKISRKEKKKLKKLKKKKHNEYNEYPDEINPNDVLNIDGVYQKFKEEDYVDEFFMDEENIIKDKFETYEIPETKEENSKYINNLINNSDFIIELVDSRNIKGTRNLEIEKKIKNLIILINKIDLVSKDYLKKNINNLNEEFNKLNINNNNNNNINNKDSNKKNIILTISCCNRESIANFYTELKNILSEFSKKKKKKLNIGIIGYPNVGKESFINSLKLLEIANSYKKEINFKENKLFGINSVFGTLFDNEESIGDLISKKFKNVNDIENPLDVIKNFMNVTDKEKIKKIYDIKEYKDFQGFLKEIGKKYDYDINDYNEIAKQIIQDCINGKITYEF